MRVGVLLNLAGRSSLEQSKYLAELLDLAREEEDDTLVEMIVEALDLKKQFDETMVKMINSLQRREEMR